MGISRSSLSRFRRLACNDNFAWIARAIGRGRSGGSIWRSGSGARGDKFDMSLAVSDWPILASRANYLRLLEQGSLVPEESKLLDLLLTVKLDNMNLASNDK